MSRPLPLLATLALTALACGGSSTSPNNNGNNNGSAKVVTATINGAAFSATLVSGAYLNGALTINGVNGNRSILINAINVTGTGTISLNAGNQWSATAQHLDGNVGTFSSGIGGTGTLTLTAASLSRITGTFSFTAYTTAGNGAGKPVATVTNGVFDITNP